jgi:hypothetical protein
MNKESRHFLEANYIYIPSHQNESGIWIGEEKLKDNIVLQTERDIIEIDSDVSLHSAFVLTADWLQLQLNPDHLN